MPLKEIDLKDTDTYKKASRMDLPKVAAGNAKFFIYKDVELTNPSGKKQKYPAFLALVDDNGIRKLLMGKKLICKGICGIKDERIAFEPQTGKVPYKQLKVSVPLLLGKAVWIPVGMEDDAGDGEAAEGYEAGRVADGSMPAQASAAPPQTQPASAASLSATWGKLVKDVQAHAAAHPERKESLFREIGVIADLLKVNKAEEAKLRMDRVQAMLDGPPAAAPAGPVGAAAQVAARWGAMAKQLQAISAAHPEKKADLVRASAGIPDMIRAGKLDLANKLMDTVDSVLKENPREKEYRARYQAIEGRLAAALKDPARDAGPLRAMNAFVVEKATAGDFETALKALLQLEGALEPAPVAAGAEAKKEPRKAGFDQRFAELNDRALKALTGGTVDASQIRAATAFASERAEMGDYGAATKALDRVEELLAKAGEEGAGEPGAPHEGIVKYRKALFEFAKAKSTVAAQIANLKKAIPAKMPQDADLAEELEDELMGWNDELADAVDHAINTAKDEEDPVTDAVRKSVDDYIADLASDELIRWVDKNPFAATSIGPTLRAALIKIREAMPAAA